MYSDKVIDHFQNPRNVGEIEDASGIGTVGNAKCGDMMRLYLKINEEQVIIDCKFKTYGCGAAVASSSMATEMIKGKTVAEAMKLTNKAGESVSLPELMDMDINTAVEALDGLPPEKEHCSLLAEETLHAALWDYAEKLGIKIPGLIRSVQDIEDRMVRELED